MVRRFDNRLLLIKIIPVTANNVSYWHCSLFRLALLWMIPTGTVHYSDWHFSWWFRLALFMMIPAGAVQDDSALSLFRMIPPCRCSGWFRLSLFRLIPTVAVKDDSNCRCSGWFRLSLFMVILMSLFRMIPTVTVKNVLAAPQTRTVLLWWEYFYLFFTFEKAPLAFMFIISKQCWWRYSKYTFVVRRNRICLALWRVEKENFQRGE